MRRGVLVAVATAIVLGALGFPSGALAARVHVRFECVSQVCPGREVTVFFDARPSEVNDVTIRPGPAGERSGEALITDARASLTVGSGCRAVDAHTAKCAEASYYTDDTFDGFAIRLSDRNDRLDARAISDRVDVRGGRGNDVLLTGGGDDTFHPGPGHNFLDGGPGKNAVSFDQETKPVHVDLERSGPQGAPVSHDLLRNIQNVDASHSDHDVLRGTPGDNVLSAGRYSLVVGRGGNDGLFGRAGSRLVAGRGDTIFNTTPLGALPRPSTTFVCGPGNDEVHETSLEDLVSGPCGLVSPSDLSIDHGDNGFDHFVYRPRPGKPFVKLLWGCYLPPDRQPTIAARLGSRYGPLLAIRRPRVPCHEVVSPRHYGIVLSNSAYVLLRRRHRLRVVVSEQGARSRDSISGQPYTPPPIGFTVILRSP